MTTSTTSAKPTLLLRDDAFYAPVDGGVFVLSHLGETFIRGDSAHRWLDRLAPLLDGSRTMDLIVEGLADDRAEFARRFVEGLVNEGIVREVHPNEPHALSEQELRTHAAEIDFVAYFRSSAGRAFEEFRDTTAIVVGPTSLAGTVAAACARSGVRSASVIPEDVAVDAGELETRLAETQLALHVADRPAPLRARWLESRCAALGIPLGQLVWAEGRVWTQHVTMSPNERGWSTAWRRRAAIARTQEAAGATADTVATTVAVNQFVHDAFRFGTGVREPEARPSLVELDPGTLGSTTHTFVPHPLDLPAAPLSASEVGARARDVAALSALDDDEFSARTAAFSSDTVGLFGAFVEDDLAQLPLHVTTTSVADPMGLLHHHAHLPVVSGAGMTFERARYRAALSALSCYASLAIDPRRLLTSSGEPWQPSAASLVDRSGADSAYIYGIDLADDEPVLVEATAVFPALLATPEPYQTPVGAAAGYDWRQAVAEGVVAHARELTVEALTTDGRTCPRVDPTSLAADEEIGYCLAMIDALGDELALYDVTGPSRVPVFAGVLSGKTVAYGAALDVIGAVRTCLRDTVLARQSALNAQPIYAPPSAAALGKGARGAVVETTEPRAVDLTEVVRALAEHGHHAIAVPLDHDPALHDRFPFITKVVLA